jgi:hypothetical protein
MRTTMMMVIEEAKKKCNTHHLTHSNSPTSYSDHLRRHHHQPMHADHENLKLFPDCDSPRRAPRRFRTPRHGSRVTGSSL